MFRVAEGKLPEMHVWAVIPAEEVMIDMSKGYQASQCRTMIGQEFHSRVTLPDYFWGDWNRMPDGWHYRPNAMANAIATSYARSEIRKITLAAAARKIQH